MQVTSCPNFRNSSAISTIKRSAPPILEVSVLTLRREKRENLIQDLDG